MGISFEFQPNYDFIENIWYIYDSVFCLRNKLYRKLFIKLILLESGIILKYVNLQQLSGYSDNGLFAVGFFLKLFNNEDQSETQFIQKEMRKL